MKAQTYPTQLPNRLWCAFLIIGLSSLIYLPTIRYNFVWDDLTLIVKNPSLDTKNPLPLFGKSFPVLESSGEWQRNPYYRPLITLSFWIDYQFWGKNPSGYHLTNILLNTLAGVLVAYLLTKLFSSFWLVLIGGLLFTLHPMHIESVAFIAGRTDILMTLFIFLSFLALLRYNNRPTVTLLLIILLTFAFALLSKESAILFPLLVLFCPEKSQKRKETPNNRLLFISLVAISLLYLFVRWLVLKGYFPRWERVSSIQRILLVLNALGRAVFLSLVPFTHRLVYSGPREFAKIGWLTFVGIASFGLLLGLSLSRSLKLPLRTGSAFFLFFTLPSCNWFPPGVSYFAERLLYLPTFGLVLAWVYLLRLNMKNRRRFILIISFSIFYLLLWAWDIIQRMPVWRNNLTLYQTMVKEAPSSPDAYDNLGITLKESGDIEGAIAAHRRALILNPNHAPAHNNLGSALLEAGKLNEAITEYQKALALAPDFALAHNNLGVALQLAGNIPEAEARFRQAIALKPDLSLAHNNLGEILLARGRLDSAITKFRQAIKNQPDNVLAHYNLGVALKRLGRLTEAEFEFLKTLELMPDFRPAQNSLKEIEEEKLKLK